MLSNSKTIKSVTTNKFSISVMERPNGRYYVEFQRANSKAVEETYDVLDLNMTFALFQTIYRSLEGQ